MLRSRSAVARCSLSAKNLYIPADLTFGPIFGGGTTVFGVQIKGGIRYYL